MKWIGRPLAETSPFEFFQMWGRSSGVVGPTVWENVRNLRAMDFFYSHCRSQASRKGHVLFCVHRESKKHATKLLFIFSPNIDRF